MKFISSLMQWWDRKSTLGKIGLAFIGLVIYAAVHGALINAGLIERPAPLAPKVAEALPAPDPSRISMEQYKLLSTGMSYQDVVRLLGSEGTEISSNDIGGTHTVMYQWKGGFMANMNATFQNDKLVSKAQLGLK